MLIPIGFLGGGAPAGSYELITTTILGSSTSSVTLSSIPSTYKHLEVRYTARQSGSGNLNYMFYSVNGVTSGIYGTHYLLGQGSSVISNASLANGSFFDINVLPSSLTAFNSCSGFNGIFLSWFSGCFWGGVRYFIFRLFCF